METPAFDSTQETKWFYADRTRNPIGPVAFSELQDLLNSGEIQPETYVIREGQTEWKKLSEVAPKLFPSTPPLSETLRPSPSVPFAQRDVKHAGIWIVIGGVAAIWAVVKIVSAIEPIPAASGAGQSHSGANFPDTSISAPGASVNHARLTAAECAYNLAVIEAGGPVSKNSREVARLTQLLTDLSRMTKLDPEKISDKADYVKEQIEKSKGLKISYYRLLKETCIALRDAPPGTITYTEALSGVAVILSNE